MSIELYDMPAHLRAIDDDCETCHGEPLLDGGNCPDCGGNPLTVIEGHMALLQGEVRALVPHLARRIAEMDAEADVLRDAAQRINSRLARRKAASAFLKGWIQREMEAAGIDKLKDPIATIWLQDNPESMEIVDEEKVPSVHRRATLRLPLDSVPEALRECIVGTDTLKGPLMEHLKETGEIPPGCEYHAKGEKRHLRILTP